MATDTCKDKGMRYPCDVFSHLVRCQVPVAQMVIERLDGTYEESDPQTGQFPLYGKVAGVLITAMRMEHMM